MKCDVTETISIIADRSGKTHIFNATDERRHFKPAPPVHGI
jgi:hypothetical protein